MPSTTSSSDSSDLPSSTVITPSLPTLSIASAISLPMVSSALAEIEPTWAISLEGVVGLEAFAHDGLCQHGGGGGAVTGVVAGLGGHFLDQLRAHVLQFVLELDFLGHGHAVLGHGGGAERALDHHIATLGAQGHLDRVGQDVDAFDHASAGFAAENHFFCCHLISPN